MSRIIVLLIAATALAQQPPPDGKPKLAQIRGIVVNSLTGEPLTKATVKLFAQATEDPSGGVSVEAKASGEFEFTGLKPGTYAIVATRRGFVNALRGWNRAKSVKLEAGDSVTSVKIPLAPQGVITGQITDAEGEPIEGLMVQILKKPLGDDKPAQFPAAVAATNDQGEYRAAGLSPSRYWVSCAGDAVDVYDGPRRKGRLEIYPQTFFPGVTSESQAAPVDIAAGQLREGVDFSIRKIAARRVRGRVFSEKPQGLILRGAGMLDMRPVILQSDGTFEIFVLPGRYTLLGSGNKQEIYLDGEFEVTDKDLDDVRVSAHTYLTMPVRVSWDGEAPAKASKTVVLLSYPGWRNRGEGETSFQIEQLRSGKVGITVDLVPPEAYVKALRYGEQRVQDEEIELADGAELEIVMRRGTGWVEGTVEDDGKPVPDAFVLALPLPHGGHRTKASYQGVSDQRGKFELTGVPPGEYILFAFESLEDGEWLEPDFLTRHERLGERIKLEEKGRESKELFVIR